MRLNYHIIFQRLNLLSPRLRQFHRRKMPFLNFPVPLELHLKALLEDLGPSAVVIEMIAMLFFDTVMGRGGKDSSLNPGKGVQSFPKSNYEQNGDDSLKYVQWIGAFLYHCCSVYIYTQHKIKGSDFHYMRSCQITSTQISSAMTITWAGIGIMAWLRIHMMWGRLGPRWIKTQGRE